MSYLELSFGLHAKLRGISSGGGLLEVKQEGRGYAISAMDAYPLSGEERHTCKLYVSVEDLLRLARAVVAVEEARAK